LDVEKNRIVTRSDAIFDEALFEVVREAKLYPDEATLEELLKVLRNFKNDAQKEDEAVSNCIHQMHADDSQEYDLEVQVSLIHYLNDIVSAAHNITPLPPVPASVEEALNGPDKEQWKEAINKELKQLDKHEVLKWTDQQSGRGMKTKMVLQTKYDMDYSIRFKARLVVCGYSQIKGLEYDQTFSPTVSIMIVFVVIYLASFLDLVTGSFDVHAAYVQAFNDLENYCWLSAALFGVRTRWRLNKALYGEKQAGMLWNKMLHNIMTKMGMTQCPVAPCLYYLKRDIHILIICIYVDDGLMAGTSKELLEEFVRKMHQYLPQVNIHLPLEKYVGMQIATLPDGRYNLSQSLKVDKLIADSDKNESIPMSVTYNLRKAEKNPGNESLLPITGRLRYLADRTRYDILLATGEISTGGDKEPSNEHVITANKTIRYLKSTAERALVIGGKDPVNMFGLCDASYRPEGSSKARIAGAVYLGLNSGAVLAFSKNSTQVAQSSTHAELLALYELVLIIIHMRTVLKFLGFEQKSATEIFIDNRSAIDLCQLLKITHKTATINMRINTIREAINNSKICLTFIPSELNVVDALTKPLPVELFNSHTDKLMNGFNGQSISEYIGNNKTTVTAILIVDSDSDEHTLIVNSLGIQ
jgi:hypothetical protein